MQVTVLGSGTVDPRPERASTGFALEVESQPPVLLDLGAGTLRSGLLAGIAMARVETILLTHHHPDHTSDLVPFLFARKYAPEAWQESPPLTIYGPDGTTDFLSRIFAAWPSIQPDQSKLRVVEISPKMEPRTLTGGIRLETFEAVHGDMTALSFRVHWQGKVVAFSGDTALCPGLTEAAREADVFFCECSCFPRGVEPLYCRQVHLSWEDVAEVCEIARPRQLVLTHLYEVVLARDPNPLESLRGALSIPVQLAQDGAKFSV